MENKYVSFEVYRPVKSPTEKGEYMGKTPNLEQARRAADAVGGALYGITSDGRKVLLLQRRKTKWHNVRESRLIAGTQN